LSVGNIARLSISDASADVAWNPLADGDVHSVTMTPSGQPVAGGDFIAIGGLSKRSLAMFAGDDTIFADGFE
jgi:hypothetical protein